MGLVYFSIYDTRTDSVINLNCLSNLNVFCLTNGVKLTLPPCHHVLPEGLVSHSLEIKIKNMTNFRPWLFETVLRRYEPFATLVAFERIFYLIRCLFVAIEDSNYKIYIYASQQHDPTPSRFQTAHMIL